MDPRFTAPQALQLLLLPKIDFRSILLSFLETVNLEIALVILKLHL